jgi:hypothetical protein
MNIFSSFIVTLFIFIQAGYLYSESILTPFTDNITVAKINGEPVKEYEIFGYPAAARNRKNLSHSERKTVIDEHLFNRILENESDIAQITNSPEYKKNFDSLLSKNAVLHLKELVIIEQFLKDEALKAHFEANRDKFGKDFKRDEVSISLRSEKDREIKEYVKQFIDRLKKEAGIWYDEELFLKVSEISADDPDAFASKIKEFGPGKDLVKHKNSAVNIQKLSGEVQRMKPYHLTNLKKTDVLKSLVDGQILNTLLTEEAERRGLKKEDSVLKKTREQMKYFAVSKYKEIISSDDKFVPTKEEMIDHYVSNKDDKALWSSRKMWVIEIFKLYDNSSEDEKKHKISVALEMENIRQKVLGGEDFAKYAKFYSRPFTKDGELGFIFETDYAKIGTTAVKMNEGDVSELIIQEKAISVIKVTKVHEPKLYKFEYVEEIIKRRLIDKKREEFFSVYKNELFKKYKVEYVN